MSEQEYIPGTSVIKNLIGRSTAHPYGTTDQKLLDRAETMFVSDRLKQLGETPVKGSFTFAHMRQIHRELFQDVYAWAGDPRQVPMQKHSTAYAEPVEMNSLLRKQYTSIAEQDQLRGINDREQFTRKLAGLWAEINHGHAFREGNTRSQTVFFEQLAHEAGWNLDVARFSPRHLESVYKPFVDARFEHQRIRGAEGVSAQQAALALAGVLDQVIEPDGSPEGRLRRGVATVSTPTPAQTSVRDLHARNPELRDIRLDPYGLADTATHRPATDSDYQP